MECNTWFCDSSGKKVEWKNTTSHKNVINPLVGDWTYSKTLSDDILQKCLQTNIKPKYHGNIKAVNSLLD